MPEETGFTYSADFADYISNVDRASRVTGKFTDSLFALVDATQKTVENQNRLLRTFQQGSDAIVESAKGTVEALLAASKGQDAAGQETVKVQKRTASEIIAIQTGLTDYLTKNQARQAELLRKRPKTESGKAERGIELEFLKAQAADAQLLIDKLSEGGVEAVLQAGGRAVAGLAQVTQAHKEAAQANIETERKAANEIASIQTGLNQLYAQNAQRQRDLLAAKAANSGKFKKGELKEFKALGVENRQIKDTLKIFGQVAGQFRTLTSQSKDAAQGFTDLADSIASLDIRGELLKGIDLGKFDEKNSLRVQRHAEALAQLIPNLGLTKTRMQELSAALASNSLDFTKLTAAEFKAALSIQAFNLSASKIKPTLDQSGKSLTDLATKLFGLLGPISQLSQFDQATIGEAVATLANRSKDIAPERVEQLFQAFRNGTPIVEALSNSERKLLGNIKNVIALYEQRVKAQQGSGIRDELFKGVNLDSLKIDDKTKLLGQFSSIETTVNSLRLTKDEAIKLFQTLSQTGQVTDNAGAGITRLEQKMLRFIGTLRQVTDVSGQLNQQKLDGLSVELLSKLGGFGNKFDDKGIRSILTALNSVTTAAKDIDSTKIDTLFDGLLKGLGPTANLSQELQKLQLAFLNLIDVYKKAQSAASGANSDLFNGLDFDKLKNTDQKVFLSSLNSLQAMGEKAGYTDAQMSQLFATLKSGSPNLTNLSKVERELIAKMLQHIEVTKKLAIDNDALQKSLTDLSAEFAKALGGFQNFQPPDMKRILTSLETVKNALNGIDPKKAQDLFQHLQSGGIPLTNLSRDMAKLQTSLLGLINAFQKAGAAGEDAGQRVFLSWHGLARLLVVQQLHTAIGRFNAALSDAVRTSTDFSIRIAQIQTISSELENNILKVDKSTQAWSRSLRSLSDEFNLDILDVAGGAYQAISNQITNAAQSQRFLADAAAFAKLNVATLDESVNLLSSTLNSYSLGLKSTIRSQNTLFKTIELGRVLASDMADTFGNVTILGSQLGVEMEEVGAAIAGISRQGVKADNTLTFLRNLFLKLIDPTDAMIELYNKWNVESGQAAVAQFGLVGVLRKLQDELQNSGNSAALAAELLGRIRAIIPALALTGRDTFAQFEADLKEFGVTQDQIEKNFEAMSAKLDLITQSAGEKFRNELNQTRNVISAVFGDDMLRLFQNFNDNFFDLSDTVKVFAENTIVVINTVVNLTAAVTKIVALISNFTLGTEGSVITLQFLTGAITSVVFVGGGLSYLFKKLQIDAAATAISLGTVKLALDRIAVSANTAWSGLNKITVVLTVLSIGYTYYTQLVEEQNAAIRESHAKTADAIAKAGETAAKRRALELAKELRLFEVVETEKTRIIKQQLNARIQATKDQIKASVTIDEPIIDALKTQKLLLPEFDLQVPKIVLEEPEDFFNHIEKQLQDSLSAVDKIKDSLKDFDTKDLQGLLQDYQNLSTKVIFNNQTLKIEDVQKSRDLFQDILNTIEKIRDIRIKAVEKLKKDLEDSVKLLDKLKGDFDKDLFGFQLEGLTDANKLTAIDARIQGLIAKSKQFEIAGEFEKARDALDEAIELTKEQISIQKSGNKDLADLGIKRAVDTTNFEDVSKKRIDLEERIKQTRSTGVKTAEQELTDFENDAKVIITQRLANEEKAIELIQKRSVAVGDALKYLKEEKKLVENINILLDEQIKKRQKLNQTLTDGETALNTFIGDVGGNLSTLTALFDSMVSKISLVKDSTGQDFLARAAEIEKNTLAVLQSNTATQAEKAAAAKKAIDDANKLLNDFSESEAGKKSLLDIGKVFGSTGKDALTPENKEKFAETDKFFADAQNELRLKEQAVATTKAAITELQKEVALNVQLLAQHGLVANAAANSAQQQANAQAKVNDALKEQLQLLDQLRAKAVASGTIKVPPINQGNLTTVKGNDTGGHIVGKKGMDANMIPVSNGEFVVNAKNTARFKSQIQAMNLGIPPRGFDTGGQVTNFNGGINVSIHGGKTNEASAREIASLLRTEMRRGNVRL